MATNVGPYAWTVPDVWDPPDGPDQFTELANDIAATVQGIDTRTANALTICTSTTRPASPVQGMAIFETDTNRRYTSVKYGSTSYWVPPPGTVMLSVRQTVTQSPAIPTASAVALTYDAVDYNPFNTWVTGAANKFLPTWPGRYEFSGLVQFNGNATGIGIG